MDFTYRNGDIAWFHDIEPCCGTHVMHGKRPAIIVSPDTVNFSSSTVIIVPMTTNIEKKLYPGQFDILLDGRIGRVCCAQVRVVDKHRLSAPHSSVSPDVMAVLRTKLAQMVGANQPEEATLA